MGEYQIIDGVLEEMKQQSMLKDRNIVLLDDFTMESCYKIQYSFQNNALCLKKFHISSHSIVLHYT